MAASGRSPAFGHSVYFGLIFLAGTILGRIVPVVTPALVCALAVMLTSRRWALRERRHLAPTERITLPALSVLWLALVTFPFVLLASTGPGGAASDPGIPLPLMLGLSWLFPGAVTVLCYQFLAPRMIARELVRTDTASAAPVTAEPPGGPVPHAAPDLVPNAEVPTRHPAPAPDQASSLGLWERKRARTRGAIASGVAMAVLWPVVGMTALLVVIFVVAFAVAGLGALGLPVPEGEQLVPLWVAVSGLLLAGFRFAIGRLAGSFPTDGMVLWLRRFNRWGGFPFHVFLERACRGVAVPVTLQDSVVAGSPQAADYRAGSAIPIVLLTLAIAFVAVAGTWGPGAVRPSLTLAGILAVIGLLWTPIARYWQGALQLRSDAGEARLRTLLERIESGGRVPPTLTVLSCPDDRWQEWVRTLLGHADVVIVDVSDVSEHLARELEQVGAMLRPEQLIVACGVDPDAPTGPWHDREPVLVAALGPDGAARCHRFTYPMLRFTLPGRLGQIQYRRWFQRKENVLLDLFAQAFEAAGPSGDLTPRSSRSGT